MNQELLERLENFKTQRKKEGLRQAWIHPAVLEEAMIAVTQIKEDGMKGVTMSDVLKIAMEDFRANYGFMTEKETQEFLKELSNDEN